MKKIINKIKQLAENSIDIYLYGDIYDSWWDENSNSAKTLKDKLLEFGNITEINLHINSLGGDVIEGIAIFNLLKQHQATVNVYVDGFACSIASVIAMAGDKIYMPNNTMMMIHNCWTYVSGNAKDLRKTADDLDKIMQSSIESYMSKVNITEEELKELLDNETWLTAQECLDMGFADELLPISDEIEQSASKSIIDLVKENQNLRMQINKTKEKEFADISEKSIEEIVNRVVENIKKDDSKKQIKNNQVKEDLKNNIFESFFNGILKNEREEK